MTNVTKKGKYMEVHLFDDETKTKAQYNSQVKFFYQKK